MNKDGRQFNVVHQSLIRPVLVMGAERSLVIPLYAVAVGLILGVGNRYAAGAGIFLAVAGHAALAWLATKDADFSKVYIRNLFRCQQDVYPARAGIAAVALRANESRALQILACWTGVPLACLAMTLMLPFSVATWVGVTLGLVAAGLVHWQLLQRKDPRPTVPAAVKRWF
jgi:type IV secretion system protein TrbD